MKVLMATSDYDDRILALREFKKLNVAHSIDFVSTGEELEEYLNSRRGLLHEVPDLLLINSDIITKDYANLLTSIKLDSGWSRLEVVMFSSLSNLRKKILWNEGTMPDRKQPVPMHWPGYLAKFSEVLLARMDGNIRSVLLQQTMDAI